MCFRGVRLASDASGFKFVTLGVHSREPYMCPQKLLCPYLPLMPLVRNLNHLLSEFCRYDNSVPSQYDPAYCCEFMENVLVFLNARYLCVYPALVYASL